MQCQNCVNNAMFMIGPQGSVPVCLDCYVKWSQVQQQALENLERQHNMLAQEIESTWGLPGSMPRYPPRSRPPTVIAGVMNLHNISIANSNVGVVNTGTIGTIDGAIGLLKSGGEVNAANAFKTLTEAVVASGEIEPSKKREIVEMLSVLAAEASAPRERRRSAAMRAILQDLANAVTSIAGLTDLWKHFGGALLQLFQ